MNAWPADLMIQLSDFMSGRFALGAELRDADRIPATLEAATVCSSTLR